jgi:hypothetical protein
MGVAGKQNKEEAGKRNFYTMELIYDYFTLFYVEASTVSFVYLYVGL